MEPNKWHDEYLAECQQIVDEVGVLIQYVADNPPFAYTVGLAKEDHPEIIVFGPDPEIAHGILMLMSMPVLAGKRTWHKGPSDRILGNGVPAMLLEVTDSSEHLTVANRLYGDPDKAPIPALQVVFPDKAGRWPWQPGSKVAALPVIGSVP